jgi:uncharacterized integral membrane protein
MHDLPVCHLDHNELLRPLGNIILFDSNVVALLAAYTYYLVAWHWRWPEFVALLSYATTGAMSPVMVGPHIMVFLVTVAV